MQVKVSVLKCLFRFFWLFVFGTLNYYLIKALLTNGLEIIVLMLAIFISFLIMLFIWALPKWIYFLITGKPIIELSGNTFIEYFDHNISINVMDISCLKWKYLGNPFGPSMELRIYLHSEKEPFKKKMNVSSLKSSRKMFVVYPITLGYQGGKKLTDLCYRICEINPNIKLRRLGTFDSWT